MHVRIDNPWEEVLPLPIKNLVTTFSVEVQRTRRHLSDIPSLVHKELAFYHTPLVDYPYIVHYQG